MKFRKRVVFGCLALAGLAVAFPAVRRAALDIVHPGWNRNHRFTLPNGWRLTPAGRSLLLPGDMPANIVLLDGGRKALINTCGYHDQTLNLIDVDDQRILQSIPLAHSWIGLGMPSQDEAWVSGGDASDASKYPMVHRIKVGETLTEGPGISIPSVDPKARFVSSILAGKAGVYCLNIQTDELCLVDASGAELAHVSVGYRPYGLALSPDQSFLAVSNWGDRSVSLLNPETLALLKNVSVGPMPSSMTYAPDGRLFVSESGSDTVAVIEREKVIGRVRTGIDRHIALGSTPVGMALSPSGQTLFVANAGNNCVTVVDVSHPGRYVVQGYIPTERYPTSVAITPDGKKLLVATAKGYYGANALPLGTTGKGVNKKPGEVPFHYIPDMLEGRLSILNVPTKAELARLTKETLANQPRGIEAAPSVEARLSLESNALKKIKHVVYVIRENRTYDQEMGDLPRGNGDPKLTLFGAQVTPNGHKILNDFCVLDNLYTDGEVSQVGHQWTDSAYGNDYTEHQWVLDYSDRGEVKSDPRLTSSPGEYIWTLARKHGLSARVFGEYVNVQEEHDSLENPKIKADPEKYGFSSPFEKIFARGGRDTEKVDEFLNEMGNAEKTGKWPSLMVMALPEDHTRGMSAGSLSPRAMVANNDKAVGHLVDAVSHSKFWKDTAIFVIEDDAQDGPDHVDAHRTVGFAVSPYIQRGIVDSTQYSTSSMLRTIELILGLPPMTQYDAKATPMYASFTTHPDFAPYKAAPPEVDVNERNPAHTALAYRSSKLDFSDIDRADPVEFNHILWKAYRPNEPYPTFRR
jgi:DNA-binding beta-propeller fold protein YncE